MHAAGLPQVRLLIADAELRQRTAAALCDAAVIASEPPENSLAAELIISDDPAQLPAPPDAAVSLTEPLLGTILLGAEPSSEAAPPDEVLPTNCSPRELQLACRLLTQVVRLRRKLGQADLTSSSLALEARLDPLTGCGNRRAWDLELAARLAVSSSTGQSLCLALFDVDYLKQVNSAWGHQAGDQLLRAMAAGLRDSLRQSDFVARLGGDEFGGLLSGLEEEEAAAVVERVRNGLPGRLARAGSKVAGISAGYALYRGEPAIGMEQFVAAAERALRKAKEAGREKSLRGDLGASE